jgi:hypothetical protein
VPPTHEAYAAIEFLKEQGILQGYADGTFKPGNTVNRAEALKILVGSLLSADQINALKNASNYQDVPSDAWFAPYVEGARGYLKIIDGPPKTTAFNPTRPINLVEFLKLLLLSNNLNPQSLYSDLVIPLGGDASNVNEWYYPHIRLALANSVIMANEDGTFGVSRQLTRADIAQYVYRLAMYRENRRAQALLTLAENEILNVLAMLEQKNVAQAEYAAARSLVAARGALTSRPDEALVKGAVKTAEGFRTIVAAYRAGLEGRLEDVLKLSSDAWHLAEKVRGFSSNLETVAAQMQNIAKSMADEARALQAQAQNPQ